ncbi:MAG: DUF84 family protein [Candidatus Woesearchaeota archaeon]
MYKIIAIGSTNSTKVDALRDILEEYPELFSDPVVMTAKVSSGVADQPIGFDQIISGAKNRAKTVYEEVGPDLGVGLEDGLAEVPHTETGYMNFCASAIYNGHDFFVAMSGGYEYPKEVIEMILERDMNITDSFLELGLSDKNDLGAAEGAIGVMSRGRENRIDGTKIALRRALMKIENANLF